MSEKNIIFDNIPLSMNSLHSQLHLFMFLTTSGTQNFAYGSMILLQLQLHHLLILTL